jgi:hypothetical protein
MAFSSVVAPVSSNLLLVIISVVAGTSTSRFSVLVAVTTIVSMVYSFKLSSAKADVPPKKHC